MDFVTHIINGSRLIDDTEIIVSSPVPSVLTASGLKRKPALPFDLAPDIRENEVPRELAVVLSETVSAMAIQKNAREPSVCVESFEP